MVNDLAVGRTSFDLMIWAREPRHSSAGHPRRGPPASRVNRLTGSSRRSWMNRVSSTAGRQVRTRSGAHSSERWVSQRPVQPLGQASTWPAPQTPRPQPDPSPRPSRTAQRQMVRRWLAPTQPVGRDRGTLPRQAALAHATTPVSTAAGNWFWPTFHDRTGPGSVLDAVIIAGHVTTKTSMISYRT